MGKEQTHLRIKSGFEGATWLTPEQWDTYRRGSAVRYVRKTVFADIPKEQPVKCEVCGQVSKK